MSEFDRKDLECGSPSLTPMSDCRQATAVRDGLAEPAALADPQRGFFLPPIWTHTGILAESLTPDPVGCSPSKTSWRLGAFG